MNSEQLHMAADVIAISGEYLGDHYGQLRDSLNQSLGGLAVESSAAEAIKNRELIGNCIEMLPHISKRTRVTAQDPAELRSLQTFLVWVCDKGYPNNATPYLLVGHHEVGRSTQLLMHGLSKDNKDDTNLGSLLQGTVSTKKFQRMQQAMGQWQHTPLDETELNAHYTEKSGYHLTSEASPAVVLTIDAEDLAYRRRGRLFVRCKDVTKLRALSDHKLAIFNVFGYLGEQAARFGLSDEFQRLLRSAADPDGVLKCQNDTAQ